MTNLKRFFPYLAYGKYSTPHIAKDSPFVLGRIEVEGLTTVFKDAKLFPGGAREWEWDWNETGTRHDPGIQSADVEELLEKGATVVVLSQGVYRCLGVCPETLENLLEGGVEHHVLQTQDAVRLYNELSKSHPVGGLFHSTC